MALRTHSPISALEPCERLSAHPRVQRPGVNLHLLVGLQYWRSQGEVDSGVCVCVGGGLAVIITEEKRPRPFLTAKGTLVLGQK